MESRLNTVLTAVAGLKVRLLLVVAGLACALMVSALIYPALLSPPTIDGAELASTAAKKERVKRKKTSNPECTNCQTSILVKCGDEECGWWYDIWHDCCNKGDVETEETCLNCD
ncbi:MAG: hypothetical protein OXU68_07895 [Bacteroidota bacterium]|nr:hypothetical protein [Bacteroidota bacterium]MDE2956908.1 hypothetical protein [Bacteroidota bacterium]